MKNQLSALNGTFEGLKRQDHACLIYETDEQWQSAVIPFVGEGLKCGDRFVYIAGMNTAREIRSHLHSSGTDATQAENQGRLVIVEDIQAYVDNPELMIAFLVSEAEKSGKRGFPALRVALEMGWMLGTRSDSERLSEFELKLNSDLFRQYPCIGLCQYDRRRSDPEFIRKVLIMHPLVVVGGHVYKNTYCVPHEKYGEYHPDEAEIEHWLDRIVRDDSARRERKFLAGLIENTLCPFVAGRADGTIIDCNRAFCELTGYTKDELKGLSWIDTMTVPEWRNHEMRILEELRMTGIPVRYEKEYLHKTGTKIPVELAVQYGFDRQGDKECYTAFVTDLTERSRIEERIRKNEARYKALFETNNDAILILKDDAFVECNNKALLMFGCTREQIIGKTPYDFSPPSQYSGNDSKDEAMDRIRDTFTGGYQIFEWRHCRLDGTVFDTEVSLNELEVGAETYIQAIVRDITDRKYAERIILESEAKYRDIFDNTIEGIFQTSPDGRYLTANHAHAKILGYESPDDLIASVNNIPGEIYVDHEDRKRYTRLMERDGSVYGFEAQLRRKDGSTCWAVINGRVVKNSKGDILYYEGTIEDIDARKKAESELQEVFMRFQNMTKNVPGMIYQFMRNPEGVYSMPYVSDAVRKFGLEPSMVAKDAQTIFDLVSRDDLQPLIRSIEESAASLTPWDWEGRFVVDGKTLWYKGVSQPRKMPDGAVLWDGLIMDITKLKQTEDLLIKSMEKMRIVLAGTIQAMSATVETRDPYTAGHQRRVSNLAWTIAQEMNLQNDSVDAIRMAGIVHDIGKMSIPAEILSKPGYLSSYELELIKVHPKTGYDILKEIEFPWPVARIVYQHHERLDGSGYPEGIGGEEILLEARILAVADVVEAMASHRPYRPAKGIEFALNEIEDQKGVLFDPEVVDTCLRLFREAGFTFGEPDRF